MVMPCPGISADELLTSGGRGAALSNTKNALAQLGAIKNHLGIGAAINDRVQAEAGTADDAVSLLVDV